MNPSSVYRVTAFIVRRSNVGEADKILTIFSTNIGKLRVIAKGIRKISSRRGPHVDLFNEVSMMLHRGKSMDIVTEVTTIKTYRTGLSSWIRMRAAYLVVEILDKLVPEHVEHRDIYSKLHETLEAIEKISEEQMDTVLLSWCNSVLLMLGFLSSEKQFSTLSSAISFVERVAERKIKTAKFFLTI
jgi:DNA repair protein RecO (recombination protein O)